MSDVDSIMSKKNLWWRQQNLYNQYPVRKKSEGVRIAPANLSHTEYER